MSRIHLHGRRSPESVHERPQRHHEAAVGEAKASLGRGRVGLIATLAAMAVAGQLAPSAQAASTTPGDFSSYITGNPTIAYVDDCTVEIGPVVDSIAAPGYRKIGGVRVNCDSVHSLIQATVWEQYSDGSAWVDWGSSSVGTRYNQAGSGSDQSGILRSPPYCSPDPSYVYYWRTAAYVQTENGGAYVYSAAAADPSGC